MASRTLLQRIAAAYAIAATTIVMDTRTPRERLAAAYARAAQAKLDLHSKLLAFVTEVYLDLNETLPSILRPYRVRPYRIFMLSMLSCAPETMALPTYMPVMEQLQEYMAAEAALDVRKMDVYFKELRIDHIPPQYIPAAVQENVADILVRLLVGLWVHPNIARLPSDASLSGNTSQSRDTSRPSGLAQSTDDEVPRATSEPREATGGRLDRDPRAASEPPDAGQSTDVSQLQDNGGPMETSEPGHLGQANDHQKPRAYSEPRDIHQSEDATEQRAIRPHRARSDPRGARR